MLVEELWKIQKRHGWLPPAELRAMGQRLNLPLHRVHEVASSAPAFRLLPPPQVEVKVCRDMACYRAGARRLTDSLSAFSREFTDGSVEVRGVSCLGQCDRAVAMTINHRVYPGVTESSARAAIRKAVDRGDPPHDPGEPPHDPLDGSPPGWVLDVYANNPQYSAVRQYLEGGRNADALLRELETAGLRGLGGVGFPTFRKWSSLRGAPGDEKFVICNVNESEPGDFRGRELLRRVPWLVIEGAVLAALVVGARRGWVCVRPEYRDEAEVLRAALAAARERGVLGPNLMGSGQGFDPTL